MARNIYMTTFREGGKGLSCRPSLSQTFSKSVWVRGYLSYLFSFNNLLSLRSRNRKSIKMKTQYSLTSISGKYKELKKNVLWKSL